MDGCTTSEILVRSMAEFPVIHGVRTDFARALHAAAMAPALLSDWSREVMTMRTLRVAWTGRMAGWMASVAGIATMGLVAGCGGSNGADSSSTMHLTGTVDR